MASATVTATAVNTHLPTEVWNMVLGYLDKEEAILRSSNASTTFQQLLKPKVFAQALAIVQREVAETSSELTDEDILRCRLVSRDWKKMTDHFLQSRESRLDLSCNRPISVGFQHSFNDQLLNAPNRLGAICLRLNKLSEADTLVEEIVNSDRVQKGTNTLVGRHVIIVGHRGTLYSSEDAMDPDKQRFYDIVSRLLAACGQHMWYLSVCDSISDGLPHMIFNTFFKWLRLAPNLKMLTCQFFLSSMTPEKELETLTDLQKGITHQPFPYIPQLVTLQCNGIPESLLHSALDVNRHVKKVEVVPSQVETETPLNIDRWKNTPLTEFCFISCKIEELKKMTECGWPLEKLSLRFDLNLGSKQHNLEHHLQQLSNFGTTLKHLRVELPIRLTDVEEPQWQLQLPHLEALHLDVLHNARLDFIVSLNSLKKLKLSVLFYDVQAEPQVVFQGSKVPMSNLYKSDMWDALPSLNEVEVHMFKCVTWSYISFHYNRCERKQIMS